MKGSSGESLRVNVDQISDEGLMILAGEPIDRFPGLKVVSLEEKIQFLSPVQMALRVRRVSDFVEVSGSLRTSVCLSCGRCLGDYTLPLSIPFEAAYAQEITPEDAGEETDIELTSDAIDLFPFLGREIDLVEAVQEQLLLALPLRPLCREACKGLCPGCGADLNQGPCGCEEKAVDPRFAVLKNLKIDNK